jgi:hypothetical protein
MRGLSRIFRLVIFLPNSRLNSEASCIAPILSIPKLWMEIEDVTFLATGLIKLEIMLISRCSNAVMFSIGVSWGIDADANVGAGDSRRDDKSGIDNAGSKERSDADEVGYLMQLDKMESNS